MSTITQFGYSAVNAYGKMNTAKDAKDKKESVTSKEPVANKGFAVQSKSNTYGTVIGKPELSEKAQEYYEKLKKKYSNMDFILVSDDMKEVAQAQAGNFANANHMVVLIDESKIERMAVDEAYRDKYEGVIAEATLKLPELQQSLGTSGNVKAFGMQVNDKGIASYFAVLEKSSAAQKERIAKTAEKKAEQRKEAKKQAAEAQEEHRLERAKEERRTKQEALQTRKQEDTITITASSLEELAQKVQDYNFEWMSNNVQTEDEKMIGQHIDYQG